MTPLFVLPFTLLVVLASSTSGDQHFCGSYTVQTTTSSGLGTSENGWRWGPSWGKQLPGERPRETAGL
jgi:hypothetical protein